MDEQTIMEVIRMYDVVIIGAGPSGISAGIYAASRGKKVLLIEKNKIGGLIGNISTVTHYTGIIEGETGATFASRLKQQIEHAGVEVVYETVKKVEMIGEVKTVYTDQSSYETKKLILANGTTPRKLNIPGEETLTGLGMYMNAARDGEKYRNKQVYVVGGADGAVKEALYLAKIAEKVTIIHFEDQLGCISEFREKIARQSNIEVRLHSRLHRVKGEGQVEVLEIIDENTGEVEEIKNPGCGIFIYAGATPNTQLYTELHLEDGFIPVNENMETVISGVYAVGDIRVKTARQVATAVADGTIAAIHATK